MEKQSYCVGWFKQSADKLVKISKMVRVDGRTYTKSDQLSDREWPGTEYETAVSRARNRKVHLWGGEAWTQHTIDCSKCKNRLTCLVKPDTHIRFEPIKV